MHNDTQPAPSSQPAKHLPS